MNDLHKIKANFEFNEKEFRFLLRKKKETGLLDCVINSFDADADWVKITFVGFGKGYRVQKESKIIIEDNGRGIDKEILRDNWFAFNTSTKTQQKLDKRKTAKGRYVTGGCGNGRFGILLLGNKAKVTTRTDKGGKRHILEFALAANDGDSATERAKQISENNISANLRSANIADNRESEVNFGKTKKRRSNHGTVIEISDIIPWNRWHFIDFCEKLIRRQWLFSSQGTHDFEVCIYKDDECEEYFLYTSQPLWRVWLFYMTRHIATGGKKLLYLFQRDK